MHPFNAWNEVKVTQTCPTLCNPIDYTVQGTLQSGILEWVLFPFSRGASQPRDRTQVSHNCRWILYQLSHQGSPFNAYQTPNTEPARWRWEANSEREKEQTKKMSCPQGGELINKWAKRMKAAHGRRQLLQDWEERTALPERLPPADMWGREGRLAENVTSQVWKRTGRAVRMAGMPAPAEAHRGQSNSKYCGKRRGNSLQTWALSLQGKTQPAFLFPSFSEVQKLLSAVNLTKFSF